MHLCKMRRWLGIDFNEWYDFLDTLDPETAEVSASGDLTSEETAVAGRRALACRERRIRNADQAPDRRVVKLVTDHS